MRSLADMYKEKFFMNRHRLLWRAKIVCDIIEESFLMLPKHASKFKIADVGCAIGEYVEEFKKRGYIADGFDGSPNAAKFARVPITILDLRYPIKWSKNYFICLCLEVAEHIEPEYTDIFLKNLAKFSDTIVMSAAPPGQKGHHHVNCQPKKYWINKMASVVGYYLDEATTKFIEKRLEPFAYDKRRGVKTDLIAYYQNTMVFRRF